MAYNFLPEDDMPLSYLPPDSSNRSFDRPTQHFSLYQPIRTGYRVPIDSMEAEFQRYPNDLRDPVEREREKYRIRAEIMADQNERRRVLEEQVRMDLLMERNRTLNRLESSRTQFAGFPDFVHPPYAPEIDASFNNLHHAYDPLRIPQSLPLLPGAPMHPMADLGMVGSADLYFGQINPQEPFQAMHSASVPDPDWKRIALTYAANQHNVGGLKIKIDGKWGCKLCKVIANSENDIKKHFRGKKHKKIEEEENNLRAKGQWRCNLCKITAQSERDLNVHLAGRKHAKMEEREGAKSEPEGK